jgi:hypothetical protein
MRNPPPMVVFVSDYLSAPRPVRSPPARIREVWYGVAAGVAISIVFGVIFIVIFYVAKDSLFAGKRRDWFKGIICWIAALLITILGFAMLRFLGWEAKWKRKLAAAIKEKVGLGYLAPARSETTQTTWAGVSETHTFPYGSSSESSSVHFPWNCAPGNRRQLFPRPVRPR